MAIETINVGTIANDGTGDTLRGSFIKCNDNFEQLVPYNGATENLDLGTNDLYTNKVYLYDEPNDNFGSIHYTDGNFHVEDSDGHKLLVLEDGFVQLHKTDTIQSNLFTIGLTETRDHYLPNSSGTIATNESIELGVETNSVTTPSLSILDSVSGYSSNIIPNPLSGDWELLTPDSSGTIALLSNIPSVDAIPTDGSTNPVSSNGVFDALATKQNFFKSSPYKYFNLNQSIGSNASGETQLIRVEIPANSFGSSDKFYFRLGFKKVGAINASTIRIKLSTSATMPTGSTDQIATGSIGTTALYAPIERTMGIIGGNLKGFNFTNSNVSDSATSTASWSSVALDVTQTQYFYVSITPASSTTDVSYLEFIEISNI